MSEVNSFVCPHCESSQRATNVNFTIITAGVYMLSCGNCHKALGPYFVPSPEDFAQTS